MPHSSHIRSAPAARNHRNAKRKEATAKRRQPPSNKGNTPAKKTTKAKQYLATREIRPDGTVIETYYEHPPVKNNGDVTRWQKFKQMFKGTRE